MLTEHTLTCLRRAGWHGERTLSLEDLRKDIAATGFEFLPSAERFLMRFGYLEISFPIRRLPVTVQSNLMLERFVTDPKQATGMKAADYATLLGESVCPIGTIEESVVFATASHRYYNAVDDYVYLLSADADDAMNAICEDRAREPTVL